MSETPPVIRAIDAVVADLRGQVKTLEAERERFRQALELISGKSGDSYSSIASEIAYMTLKEVEDES